MVARPVDVDVVSVSQSLAPKLDRILNAHHDLTWRYSGYVADHEETKKRSVYGGIALFLALYALLAIPFRLPRRRGNPRRPPEGMDLVEISGRRARDGFLIVHGKVFRRASTIPCPCAALVTSPPRAATSSRIAPTAFAGHAAKPECCGESISISL